MIKKLASILLMMTIPTAIVLFYALAESNNRLDTLLDKEYSYESRVNMRSYSEVERISEKVDSLSDNLEMLKSSVIGTRDSYKGLMVNLNYTLAKSLNPTKLTTDIYEERILRILGDPIAYRESSNNQIKIFKLDELGYRGFMAKLKLYDPSTFRVVLADDEPGGYETTSSMAKREGAILAINGGGFGKYISEGRIKTTMVGGTVVDSKVVKKFIKTNEEICFVGIDIMGNLVGTVPSTQKDIDKLKAVQGLSFIPKLIENHKKVSIPTAWINTKHPRTVIGEYPNGDILLIIIDGRNDNWSEGVTLERVQEKLIYLGVEEAYNLDGGGSTTLYYKGEILNKPSDGVERSVANSFIVVP